MIGDLRRISRVENSFSRSKSSASSTVGFGDLIQGSEGKKELCELRGQRRSGEGSQDARLLGDGGEDLNPGPEAVNHRPSRAFPSAPLRPSVLVCRAGLSLAQLVGSGRCFRDAQGSTKPDAWRLAGAQP